MRPIMDAHLHCEFNGMDNYSQLEKLKCEMKQFGIEKAILYMINERDYEEQTYALNWGTEIIPAMMLEPRDESIDAKMEVLRKEKIRLLKLLPYEQQILYQDFDVVSTYAKKIQDQGMALTICGAYGSKYIYSTNGVELAERVLRDGFKNPLILAHGGMTRILDAFSLMQEYPNLYIDISFVIPFWWDSHVIQDLYFVMKNMNYDRIFWGSDYPNHSFEQALSMFDKFCEKYQINDTNKNKVLYENFRKFYQGYLS